MMKNFFVILAAGKSQRLNSKIPKPYLQVNNKSIGYFWSMQLVTVS